MELVYTFYGHSMEILWIIYGVGTDNACNMCWGCMDNVWNGVDTARIVYGIGS